MAARTPDERLAILDAAGEARMRAKAERLALAVDTLALPAEEVFYTEFMCALGYKHNRAPFRRLASIVPLRQLRRTATNDPHAAYAMLLGVAGLLPNTTSRSWNNDTNTFVRALWDHWWKMCDRWEHRSMDVSDWTLANQRPHNHPLRRLAGAASLFASRESLYETILSLPTNAPRRWFQAVKRHVDAHSREIEFWNRHLALGGKPAPRPVAIIGRGRIASVVTNLVVPLLAAEGRDAAPLVKALPAAEDNAIVRQTAHSLFGPDHNPALYRTGLRQQGLIQIFHDFCLDSTTDCSDCALAEALERSS